MQINLLLHETLKTYADDEPNFAGFSAKLATEEVNVFAFAYINKNDTRLGIIKKPKVLRRPLTMTCRTRVKDRDDEYGDYQKI